MLQTGLNNAVLHTLFNVVNNTERVVEPGSSLQSSVTILNNIVDNIVDNIEQHGQHNIVHSAPHPSKIMLNHDKMYRNG